jgi:hypothetical protein
VRVCMSECDEPFTYGQLNMYTTKCENDEGVEIYKRRRGEECFSTNCTKRTELPPSLPLCDRCALLAKVVLSRLNSVILLMNSERELLFGRLKLWRDYDLSLLSATAAAQQHGPKVLTDTNVKNNSVWMF